MRQRSIALLLSGLCLLAVLLMALPGFLASRQNSFNVAPQREWIQATAQELAQVPPPAEISGNGLQNIWWNSLGYLLFSNGWASYKIHTIHDGGGIGDVSVLRTSDGALYLSHTHFCTGITELMRPRPDPDLENQRPADAMDFFEHYGRWQGWDLLARNSRLWCAINTDGQENMHNRKKRLFVWISSGEGTNRTALLDRSYTVTGSYVSWNTRWLSNECFAIDIYDYGLNNTPRNRPPDLLRSNHIISLAFRRDAQTGMFTEN